MDTYEKGDVLAWFNDELLICRKSIGQTYVKVNDAMKFYESLNTDEPVFVVDTFYERSESSMRYGRLMSEIWANESGFRTRWPSTILEEFPPKFKTLLLLLEE